MIGVCNFEENFRMLQIMVV